MTGNDLSERIRLGMARAKREGVTLGRPRRGDVDPVQVAGLRDGQRLSWPKIAAALDAGQGTVRRAYRHLKNAPQPCQKGSAEVL
jgi:DNA invertase Pin-like site-specific DNA recombinase